MKNENLLTTFGAARILDVSVERVRQLEREGKLKAQRAAGGRFRLFRRDEVERLAELRSKTQEQSKMLTA